MRNGTLPPEQERLLDMVVQVTEANKGALDPVLGILNIALAMAHRLNASQRHVIAERLRAEVADLEQQ